MFDINDFPQRISTLRIAKNVSAREMSLAIGQNPGYIQNIESGKALPSMRVFFYICEYLNVSPSAFFDTDNQTPGKLQEVLADLKPLDEKQLEIIRGVAKQFIK